MRVLLVIDWNKGRGGAEAYALYLRNGLQAAGDEVRLLTSSAGSAGDGTADYVAYGTEQVAAQAVLQIVNPLAYTTVRRALREFRPDVVWVNMFAQHLSPAALSAIGKVPTVLLVSDYKLVCPVGSKLLPSGDLCSDAPGAVCYRSGCVSLPHWLRDQPRYALIRSALRPVDRVLACSSWVQRELQEAGMQADVMYVPTPAISAGFLRQPAAEPTFLFCGRLSAEKGVDLLIRAFGRLRAEFPTATLAVAGTGDELAALQALARSLVVADAVDFLGWLSPEQLDGPLAECWASVVPSLWAEPQGLVAVEAMLRGVPVVCSESGGLGEMVEEGVSGLLFPNNDEAALLDCLRRIASGSIFPGHVLSDEVMRNAQAKYDFTAHVEDVRRVFEETIEGRSTGTRALT